ncbi:MAG TPA: DUF3151 domain-containing protein [Actinomycetales bacterium]|jgi:hypothetical protein|nr:DUF3151 domain-containing protein [Actinomycetales bacterium]
MTPANLLGDPAPTLLPDDHPDVEVARRLAQGESAHDLAIIRPSSSLVWAVLAEDALDRSQNVQGYAFARTGYHRGLDSLRRAGWKGHGPVPGSHAPNQGVLRAFAALARAAEAIGEDDEALRMRQLLHDSDPAFEVSDDPAR